MKKLTIALLSLTLLLGCCACGEKEENSEPAKSEVTTSAPEVTEAAEEPTEAETEPEEEALPGFDVTQTTVIYDENSVKITVDPPELDKGQWKLNYVVENNSGAELSIDMKNISMNGYTFSDNDTMSPINAGETKDFDKRISLRSSDLTKPAYATMNMVINNKTDKEVLADLGEVMFRFADYGFEEPDKDTSVPLCSAGGVDLYVQPAPVKSEEFPTVNVHIFGVSSASETVYFEVSNAKMNGNDYSSKTSKRSPILSGSRILADPFENFNNVTKYGLTDPSEVTSIEFDLLLRTKTDDLANYHVTLGIGDTITVESVEAVEAE